MRWTRIGWVFALMLAAGLALAACETSKTTTAVNVTITGPFERCTVIILPDGRGVVFSDGDVAVRDGNTITVGQATYNVNLDSCAAATTTTTTTGGTP